MVSSETTSIQLLKFRVPLTQQLGSHYGVNIERKAGGHQLEEIEKQDDGCVGVFTNFEPDMRDFVASSQIVSTRLQEQIATSPLVSVLIKIAVTPFMVDAVFPFTTTAKQEHKG